MKRKATSETIYRIGSLTKQITAIALLRMASRGIASLNDLLSLHVSDAPGWARAATLRELATHTGGAPDNVPELRALASQQHRPDDEEQVALSIAQSTPVGPPGEPWHYSNIGYLRLGRLITCRTGQSYKDWLNKELFAPLGLVHTGECDAMVDHPLAAAPYDSQTRGHIADAESVNMATVGASGAICSTVLDLIALDTALAEGRLLAMSATAELGTSACLRDGTNVDYGLGVFVGKLGGYREMLHRGDIPGGAAFKAYYPDVKLSIIVLSNTLGAPVATTGRRLARTALGLPAPAPTVIPTSAKERQHVAGIYGQQRLTVRVSVRDNQVVASTPDGLVMLLAQGGNKFVSATDSDMRFTFEFTPTSGRLHVTGPGFRFNGIRHQ